MTDFDTQVLDAQYRDCTWSNNMDYQTNGGSTDWTAMQRFDVQVGFLKPDGTGSSNNYMEDGDVSMTRHNSAPGCCTSTKSPSPPLSAPMTRHGSMPTKISRPSAKRTTRRAAGRPNEMSHRRQVPNQHPRFNPIGHRQAFPSDSTVGLQLPVHPNSFLISGSALDFGGISPLSLSPNDAMNPLNQQVGLNFLDVASQDGQGLLTNSLEQHMVYSPPTSGVLTPSSSSPSEMSRQASTASNFYEVHSPTHFLESQTSSFSIFPINGDNSPVVPRMPFDVAASNDCFPNSLCHVGVVDDAVSFPSISFCPASDLNAQNTMREVNQTGPNADRYRHRQHQITQSARAIAPKPTRTESTIAQIDGKLVTIRSSDGTSRSAVAIPKAPVKRREGDRIYCVHCDQFPEGFRGKHELRRHIDRAHSTYQKKWIAVDKFGDGSFLANCKSCSKKKEYSVYYNCAAHLRRAHFHPCTKRGKGSNKNGEGRGGKTGGNDPPIEFLKERWMMEVEVKANGAGVDDDYDDESGASSSCDEMVQDTSDDIYNFQEASAQIDVPNLWDAASYIAQPTQLFGMELFDNMNEIPRNIVNVDPTQLFNNFDFEQSNNTNVMLEMSNYCHQPGRF